MPAFKGVLSPEQTQAIYAYVKGRADKRIPAGRPAQPGEWLGADRSILPHTSMTPLANIGPNQRRKRMSFGAAFLVLAGLAAAALISSGVPRGWRLMLVLPLWAAALGLFQARERTWVKLAARGQRDMDAGPEPIADATQLSTVRRQARVVRLKSLLFAGALTALLFLVWSWQTSPRSSNGGRPEPS
jgi:hypothetical protein